MMACGVAMFLNVLVGENNKWLLLSIPLNVYVGNVLNMTLPKQIW